MLAVVGASAARLHANSVAFCLARAWSGSGRPVALIDADTAGSALYERLGEATTAVHDPARRGLASLMASRTRLTTDVLAEHSYEMGRGPGSLWMLLGPRHPGGGGLAASWLAEHFDGLVRIDSERTVVVAASLLGLDLSLSALLARMPAATVVAPVGSSDDLGRLRDGLQRAGLAGRAGCTVGLVVEGNSPLSDGEISDGLGIEVAGRLRVRSDAALLRAASRRRRGRFAKDVEALASRLAPAASAPPAAGAGDSAARRGVQASGARTASRDATAGAARSGIGVAGCGRSGQRLGLASPAGAGEL